MANPNDHAVDEIIQPNRTEYPLDESFTFSGRPGYLYPVYCREAVIGDTLTLSPNINLRFAPTVQPLMTRMKVVIDCFAVPFQAIWKNSPFFYNAKQNKVNFMPEMPMLKHQVTEDFFSTGKLADFLGVATTMPDVASIPFSQDFNISFDNANCLNRPATLSHPAGQKIYQSCYLGAFESKCEKAIYDSNPSINPQFADTDDGDEFMERLYSVYGMHVNSQVSSFDFRLYNGATQGMTRDDINCCPYSINDSFLMHFNDGTHLYGVVRRSLMVGAITQLSNFNDSRITDKLSGRFHLNNGIMSNYNPGAKVKDLYCVLFCQEKAWDSRHNDFHYARGFVPKILAYASPSDVAVQLNQRSDSNLCSADVQLSSSALGHFNDAIDALITRSEDVPNWNHIPAQFDIYIGFFTYYPADSYDGNQGYFSLPFDENVAEDRWNSAHPAQLLVDFNSSSHGRFDADMVMPDPNIVLDSEGNATANLYALGFGDFYMYRNCLGLSVSGLMNVRNSVDADILTNKYYSYDGDTPPVIPLNSLRFRAYECIYNFWYRNRDLNPLLDSNGNRVINQYLADAQMADGVDTYNYKLRKALLEKDMFTSCLPEPLVNYAPLVGVREKDSRNVILDFAAHNGISSVSIGTETGSDGLEYTKITGYGNDIPEETMSVLRDCINQGISIHDIHSVESLTRWISNHVEHGYNTTDQQLASFGVKSDWNPLTSPIYLGGTSQLIHNGAVVSQDTDSLGNMAGLLTAFSDREDVFKYFCKERCFVMAILRVVPVPAYTTAIPFDMLKTDFTEFYMPEFDRKGWEPVKYSEIAPLMAAASPDNSGTRPDDVFGFNVPWHDYKFAFDSLHGDVRKSLSNVVLYREFGEVPVLGNAFTECDPSDYNSIYRSESPLDDKFVANIYWSARWVRPISNPQTRVF